MLSLSIAPYTVMRIEQRLTMMPAIAQGLADRPWSMEDLIERVEAHREAGASRAV